MSDDLDWAVPAYFHPAVAPEKWEMLASPEKRPRFVVVNVHNGVGRDLDSWYVEVTTRLRRAGVRLLGYIDSAYGRRPATRLVEEQRAYRERYGISGVFLDQTASAGDLLPHYARAAEILRRSGTDFVAMNPGTFPEPGYLDLADVTVCFEGNWSDYASMKEPGWVAEKPAAAICHLVYGVPAPDAARPDRAVGERRVQTVCFTRGTLPNPWDRLPEVLE